MFKLMEIVIITLKKEVTLRVL
ncbi:hypothetical protein A3Q56_01609 [Intoshia linei]|uniref:Uncharacterized protein n=1 Tax=Intoshia linei TaxID=1819745 RepID=A0A177BAG1_9BILA|nr:hypothetical protein A3Q56_01609 [Intoshia linei]